MARDDVKVVKKGHDFWDTMWYNILNALLGTIVFVAIYKLWLEQYHNYLFTFLGIWLSGILVSWTIRVFMWYFDGSYNFKHIIMHVLIAAIYSLIVWFGGITFLFDNFKIFPDLIIILICVKTFVFLLADFLSDKLSYGG